MLTPEALHAHRPTGNTITSARAALDKVRASLDLAWQHHSELREARAAEALIREAEFDLSRLFKMGSFIAQNITTLSIHGSR